MRTFIKILLSVFLALLLLAGATLYGFYWYDNNVDRSGWSVENGIYSYLDFYGDPVTGWQKIDGSQYYFFPDNAVMATYWQDIDGSRYYFSGDGTLDTGLWEIDGERYYFGEDGAMAVGWLELEGSRYYMDGGAMVTGWLEIDGQRYHFRDSGAMDTGFVVLEGETYRFLDSGPLFTGWDVVDEQLVYYLPDGPRATGWQEIDEKLYYFAKDGSMQTGWLSLGENRYYLQEDGSAAIGPTVIDGETYYFGPQGIHVILVNSTHPVPDYYSLELKTVQDWHQVSTACYSALVNMLSDCNAAGIEYTFNSAYRTIAQQQAILDARTKEYEDQGSSHTVAYYKARQTVALPGTSEHHLGLAVDLLGKEAIAWLQEHCWDYGFILRYTEEKEQITGIIDEPWHFRYVGTEVSLDMKDSGLCLEEYLGAEAVTLDKAKALYGDELYQETVWQPPEQTKPAQTTPAA